MYAVTMARLWQSTSGLRIQDQDEPNDLEVWANTEQFRGSMVKGNLSCFLENEQALLAKGIQDRGKWWWRSKQEVTTTTQAPYEDTRIVATLKLHLSGTINTASFKDVSVDLGLEYLETLDAPDLMLGLLRGFAGPILTTLLDDTVRRALYVVAGTLEDAKVSLRDTITETLLNSDNVFVKSYVPEKLKQGLAQTGIDLIEQARIGFLKRDEDFSVVVEVPWTQAETSAQLCDGLAQPGPQTAVFILPFLIVSGLILICQMRRTAIIVTVVGCVVLSGPVFRPICNNFSLPATVGVFGVDDNRIEINMTEDIVALGLPETLGINLTFAGDALRVTVDYLSWPMLKSLGESQLPGLGVGPIVVLGANLDIGLDGYGIELYPSTYIIADLDWEKANKIRITELQPDQKECTCMRRVMSFCPFKEYVCFFRMKMFFTGTVDTSSLSGLNPELNMKYVQAINMPPAVQGLLTTADSRIMVKANSMFQREMQPLHEQILGLRAKLYELLLPVVSDPQMFDRGFIPTSFIQDYSDAVVAKLNDTRLHFSSSGDDVIITAEVPEVSIRATQSLCERSSRTQYQPYRVAPFAIIAALLAIRYPRVALGIFGFGVLITSEPATKFACNQVAPSVLSNPQGGFSLAMPNSTSLDPDVESPFPSSVSFDTRFQEDKFQMVFGAVKKDIFDQFAKELITYDPNRDPAKAKQDLAMPETGKLFRNADVKVVTQGYHVAFSPKSWVSANGDMLLQE